MKCFYHNDMDGRCAGFWVYFTFHHLLGDKDLSMIPIDYKDHFPIHIIYPHEEVYIVDFSIEPNEMRRLLEITPDVTWIDHHKTAIDKYRDFEIPIRGIRYDGIAGCVLTCLYLHKLTRCGYGEIKPFDLLDLSRVPFFTMLVGDRDVWQWKYGDRTKYFYAGLELCDTSPESSVWFEAMKGTIPFEEKGKIVEQYKKMYRKELVDAYAFEVEFEGYKAIACNVGKTSSELFESVSKPYDLMIAFVYDGKQFNVSLYSETVDVSEIAKKYGGGGHRGAAGFQCKKLPWGKEFDDNRPILPKPWRDPDLKAKILGG